MLTCWADIPQKDPERDEKREEKRKREEKEKGGGSKPNAARVAPSPIYRPSLSWDLLGTWLGGFPTRHFSFSLPFLFSLAVSSRSVVSLVLVF